MINLKRPFNILILVLGLGLASSMFGCQGNPQEPMETLPVTTTVAIETQSSVTEPESSTVDLDPFGLQVIQVSPLKVDPEMMFERLGTPSEQIESLGITMYGYEDENYNRDEYYFLGEDILYAKVFQRLQHDGGGIYVGDSIAKACLRYGIPQAYLDKGLSQAASEAEILNFVRGLDNVKVEFTQDSGIRVDYWLELETGEINSFTLYGQSPVDKQIVVEQRDLTAAPDTLILKFGIPRDIWISSDASLSFDYDQSGSISIYNMGTTQAPAFQNVIRFKADWIGPYGIYKDMALEEFVQNLGFLEGFYDYGIDRNMSPKTIADHLLSFDMAQWYSTKTELQDMSYSISWNDDGNLSFIELAPLLKPNFVAEKMPETFQLPDFNPDSIATAEDLYLGNVHLGSTPSEVLAYFGSPLGVQMYWDEMTLGHQTWYGNDYTASFSDAPNFDNLESGWVYSISTQNPQIIGPRGLRVGNPISKVLDVFPGEKTLDFQNMSGTFLLYTDPETGDDQVDAAWITPNSKEPNSGSVYLNIEWYMSIYITYKDGLITRIALGAMLD